MTRKILYIALTVMFILDIGSFALTGCVPDTSVLQQKNGDQ